VIQFEEKKLSRLGSVVRGIQVGEGLGRAVACAGDLFQTTKPRILSLLLISTACPMVLAAGGALEFQLLLAALIGGALVSASASVINCIWDRDIDALMTRTKNRPLAAGRLSPDVAFIFALFLGLSGLFVLSTWTTSTAAATALFGHFFYVVVYTIWLKRTTSQNIVIGGAAGAVPPIVGWAAVTGEITATALLLFLIIFLWTPPHFWALALNKSKDYARAGVPMLPVVASRRETKVQMRYYALSLLPVSVLLVLSNEYLGVFSLGLLLILGLIFCFKIFKLERVEENSKAEERAAWEVFGFSLIYLSLFFATLVIDSSLL